QNRENSIAQLSTNYNKGANLYMICMHIGIPDSFIGLAKAKRATLQAVEAQLIMNQAITSAMDMPGS
ncbi:hypothetical protein OFP26_33335, partial [Escherichia coli]|nr:hypothetical protein [Escherichia coli]